MMVYRNDRERMEVDRTMQCGCTLAVAGIAGAYSLEQCSRIAP